MVCQAVCNDLPPVLSIGTMVAFVTAPPTQSLIGRPRWPSSHGDRSARPDGDAVRVESLASIHRRRLNHHPRERRRPDTTPEPIGHRRAKPPTRSRQIFNLSSSTVNSIGTSKCAAGCQIGLWMSRWGWRNGYEVFLVIFYPVAGNSSTRHQARAPNRDARLGRVREIPARHCFRTLQSRLLRRCGD